MQIKLNTDYALRILTYLARKERIVSSKELAEQLNIPQVIALRVGGELRDAKYIDILTGPFGGFVLAMKPREITVYDIVLLMEQTIKLNRCLDDEKFCGRNVMDACCVHGFFAELQSLLEEKMKGTTLADLLETDT